MLDLTQSALDNISRNFSEFSKNILASQISLLACQLSETKNQNDIMRKLTEATNIIAQAKMEIKKTKLLDNQ